LKRRILFYKDYFEDFYIRQDKKVKEKIDFVLDLIANVDRIPVKFLKHLEGSDKLYEIRVECSRNIFRIFCSFDEENLMILFNGFQKKTDKTPKQEIVKAVKLKNEYFNEKYKK